MTGFFIYPYCQKVGGPRTIQDLRPQLLLINTLQTDSVGAPWVPKSRDHLHVACTHGAGLH